MGKRERLNKKPIFSLLAKFILCLVFLCGISFVSVFAEDERIWSPCGFRDDTPRFANSEHKKVQIFNADGTPARVLNPDGSVKIVGTERWTGAPIYDDSGQYYSLKEAIQVVQDGQTIRLLTDIVLGRTYYKPCSEGEMWLDEATIVEANYFEIDGKSVTIDLWGHELFGTAFTFYKPERKYPCFYLKNNANLTLTSTLPNSGTDNGIMQGRISHFTGFGVGVDGTKGGGVFDIEEGSTVNVDHITFTENGDYMHVNNEESTDLQVYGGGIAYVKGILNLNQDSIIDKANAKYGSAVYVTGSAGVVNINGAFIKNCGKKFDGGNYGTIAAINGSTVNLNYGIIENCESDQYGAILSGGATINIGETNPDTNRHMIIRNCSSLGGGNLIGDLGNSQITINNSAIINVGNSDDGSYPICLADDSTITINGGVFNRIPKKDSNGLISGNGTVNVSSPSYLRDSNGYYSINTTSDYRDNGDPMLLEPFPYVYYVENITTGIKYRCLQTAINEAQDGDEIKILEDIIALDIGERFYLREYDWDYNEENYSYPDECIKVYSKKITMDFDGHTARGILNNGGNFMNGLSWIDPYSEDARSGEEFFIIDGTQECPSEIIIKNGTFTKFGDLFKVGPYSTIDIYDSLMTDVSTLSATFGTIRMNEGAVLENSGSIIVGTMYDSTFFYEPQTAGSFVLQGGTIRNCSGHYDGYSHPIIEVLSTIYDPPEDGNNVNVFLNYGSIENCHTVYDATISANGDFSRVFIGEQEPDGDHFMLIQGNESGSNGSVYHGNWGTELVINNSAILNNNRADDSSAPIVLRDVDDNGNPLPNALTINGGIFSFPVNSDYDGMINGNNYTISPDAQIATEPDENGLYIVRGPGFVDRPLPSGFELQDLDEIIAYVVGTNTTFSNLQSIFVEYLWGADTVRLIKDVVVDESSWDYWTDDGAAVVATIGPNGCHLTLDMNGHTITGSSSNGGPNPLALFRVTDYLNITSTATNPDGSIKNGTITNFAGGAVIMENDGNRLLRLRHVNITNCGNANEPGGAVRITGKPGGTVDIGDGTVIENCYGSKGYAIYANASTTENCNTPICIDGATIDITDTSGTADTSAIYVENNTPFSILSGTINYSTQNPGRVLYAESSTIAIGDTNSVNDKSLLIKDINKNSVSGAIHLKSCTTSIYDTAILDTAPKAINVDGGSVMLEPGSAYNPKPILDPSGMFMGSGSISIKEGYEIPSDTTDGYYIIDDAREKADLPTDIEKAGDQVYETNPIRLLSWEHYGTSNQGRVMYCASTSTDVPTDEFTYDVPYVSSPGIYYVHYFVKGDAAHKNSDFAYVGPIAVQEYGRHTNPTLVADTVYYSDGHPAALLGTPGSSDTGTMMYCVSESNSNWNPPDSSEYSESLPTASREGTFYVWFYSKGTGIYSDSWPECTGPITVIRVENHDPAPEHHSDDTYVEEEEPPKRFVAVNSTAPTTTYLDNITFIRSSFDPNAYANIGSPLLVLVDNDSLTSQAKKMSVDLKNFKKDKMLAPSYLGDIPGNLPLYDSLFNNGKLTITSESEIINEANDDVNKISKFTDGISKELKCTPFISTYFSADLFLCSNDVPIARITNVDKPIRYALILDKNTYEQVKGKRSYLVTLHEGSLSYKSVSFNNNIIYLDLDEFSSFSVFFADELIQLEEKQVEKINNAIFIPDFVSKIAAAGVFSLTLIVVILILRKKPKHAEK